jgi:hypothetical protein
MLFKNNIPSVIYPWGNNSPLPITNWNGGCIAPELVWLTQKRENSWLMSRLGSACYVIGAVKPYVSKGIIRMIYFAYFHSIMSYGLAFWGNTSHNSHIFKFQKRAIRIMSNSGYRDSCRELFKQLKILPFKS